jgi:glycogen operon protein
MEPQRPQDGDVLDPETDRSRDKRDNTPFAPLAAVVDPSFDWFGDTPPRTPWHKTATLERSS